jgi:hypothetical protein
MALFGQCVEYGESYVMSRILVFFTDIAQARNKEFFHVGLRYALPKQERADFSQKLHFLNIKKASRQAESFLLLFRK